MMNTLKLLFLASVLALPIHVRAGTGLEVQQVTDNVYALVGDLGNRSPENLGNNATFGVVVTDEGVVLIDSGATREGAQRIHQAIQGITDKPVAVVINSGGQDHRWLGNGYFRERGARIIASANAVKDQRARMQDQMIGLQTLVGEGAVSDLEPVNADETFEDHLAFSLGGTLFELTHAGQAHTPGDAFVWLPGQKVMFTGDIVYVERMAGVGAMSNSRTWVEVFEKMAAHEPKYIVPGHGHVTDLAGAKKDTLDYLLFLRESIATFMDEGGDLTAISEVDQGRYEYLLNFDELAGRNAQQVFVEMEWE